MVNLLEIAARLDEDERLMLKYRMPVGAEGQVQWVVRVDRLLDVAEERGIVYVERDGEPAWVAVDEALEVMTE
jgi:hypothetical protein